MRRAQHFIAPVIVLLIMGFVGVRLAKCEWTRPSDLANQSAPRPNLPTVLDLVAPKSSAPAAEAGPIDLRWRAKNGDLWVIDQTTKIVESVARAENPRTPIDALPALVARTQANLRLRVTVEVTKLAAGGRPQALKLHIEENHTQVYTHTKDGWMPATTLPINGVPAPKTYLEVQWDESRGHWTTLEPGIDPAEWLAVTGSLRSRLMSRNLRAEIPESPVAAGDTWSGASEAWATHVASGYGPDASYESKVMLEAMPQPRFGRNYFVLNCSSTLRGEAMREDGFLPGSTLIQEGSGELSISFDPSYEYSMVTRIRSEAQGLSTRAGAPIEESPMPQRLVRSIRIEERFVPAATPKRY